MRTMPLRKQEGGPCDKARLSYNNNIQRMRRKQYPMLQGTTYLDHAGTTLPAKSLMDKFALQMQELLLANPHSSTLSKPSTSHQIVESTRLKVLNLFQASPEHFELIFVANATAGIKLVAEAFSGHEEGFSYHYHLDSHTSLVGVRELATTSRCFLDEEVTLMSSNKPSERTSPSHPHLIAYPAQSNMHGRRIPLSWCSSLRQAFPHTYTLLDAAALVSTTPLDLSDPATAPDFTVLSFYKIFGFPDLGALLVRKSAAHVFDRRRYFGGGTTEMITCRGAAWVARKEARLCDRLEDGTGATHSVLALRCAMDVHARLFGGLGEVSQHTGWLAAILYEELREMRHVNGELVCQIYKGAGSAYGDVKTQGATVAFNIVKSDGTWIGSSKVGSLAAERNIHVRTGSLCNPAGMAHALGLTDDDVQRAYRSGFRCGQEHDVREGVPMGMVRVSFGAMSTLEDVDVFVRFVRESFVETTISSLYEKGKEDERWTSEHSCASRKPVSLCTHGWKRDRIREVLKRFNCIL